MPSTSRCGRSGARCCAAGGWWWCPSRWRGSPEDFHALLVAEQVTRAHPNPLGGGALSPRGLGVGGAGDRRRGLPGRGGGPVGARAGDDQRLRPHRDHRVRDDQCAADAGIGGGADRCAGADARRCSSWTGGCGRCRPGWSASCMSPGRGVGVGYVRPGRADRVAVRGVPVRGARGADVSHRGPGALGVPTGSCSIWAAPMSRSRSAATASNSARSRPRWPDSTGSIRRW